jgi:hypothetical protein
MTQKVNVAVLCQDIFDARPPHVQKTLSVPTIIDGKIVYVELQS